MDWVTIYDFADDEGRIRAMQAATTGPTDYGVSPEPALVGTPEWWKAIDQGRLPRRVTEGTMSRVYWGSMGDWPEFEMTSADGLRSTWTREGDIARFVEGLRVRVTHTLHPWKVPKEPILGAESKIVLRIEVEASERRSDPRAPGLGGVGMRSPKLD